MSGWPLICGCFWQVWHGHNLKPVWVDCAFRSGRQHGKAATWLPDMSGCC